MLLWLKNSKTDIAILLHGLAIIYLIGQVCESLLQKCNPTTQCQIGLWSFGKKICLNFLPQYYNTAPWHKTFRVCLLNCFVIEHKVFKTKQLRSVLVLNGRGFSNKIYHCVPYTSAASPVLVLQNKRSDQNKNAPNVYWKKIKIVWHLFLSYRTLQ